MPARYKEEVAQNLLAIVSSLAGRASFRNILLESRMKGALSWNVTLRKYLDLLVLGKMLKVERRDVGSVNLQELYSVRSKRATIWVGLSALGAHGLNWDVPQNDLYPVEIDISGLVRSSIHTFDGKILPVAGLEDSLAYELKRDRTQKTGTLEMVTAMLGTRVLDVPYFLSRTDLLGVGDTARSSFRNLTETFALKPPGSLVDAKAFFKAREQFLRILRQYSSKGYLRLLNNNSASTGKAASTAREISPEQLVVGVSKQLGIIG